MDDARAKRLKAALRDNLHRRKSQVRGRARDPARDLSPDTTVATDTGPADPTGTGTGTCSCTCKDRDR